jgi:DNA primase
MYEENDYRGPGKFRKVLNPERLPGQLASSELLLNLETAARYSRVVIVEGPMDAARTGADAVCTFGKKITSAQVRRLLDHGVKAVDLMWDGPKLPNEPQGTLAEMLGVAPLLRTYFDLRIVELPFGDPAEWSREHLVYFRAHAKSTFFSHTFTSL